MKPTTINPGATRHRMTMGSTPPPAPTEGDGTIWGGVGGVPLLYRLASGHLIMDELRPDGHRIVMQGPVTDHGRRRFLTRMAEAMGLRITGIEDAEAEVIPFRRPTGGGAA